MQRKFATTAAVAISLYSVHTLLLGRNGKSSELPSCTKSSIPRTENDSADTWWIVDAASCKQVDEVADGVGKDEAVILTVQQTGKLRIIAL